LARIFLSHASKDAQQAEALIAWLRGEGHTEVFLDIDDEAGIQPGDDWERRLYTEIARSQAVIVLLTRGWMQSKWCFAEFTQARALGKKIFPVVDTPAGERFVGSDLQAIDLTSEREGGLRRLSRAISASAIASASGFELPQGVAPFPGLDALGREHAAVFFGRDDDVTTLIERFRRMRVQGGERFLAILGASGAGKSSLLRAGLLPRLGLDRENWIIVDPLRPEGDPHQRLAGAIAHAAEPDETTDARERRERLRKALTGDRSAEALAAAARTIRERARRSDAGIVIAIDQLEEAFTLATEEARGNFFVLLSHALTMRSAFYAVATLRSEFLGDLQARSDLAAGRPPQQRQPLGIDPESIGREASMGCIRMKPDAVALVFDMLEQEESTITIKP